jgi:hypothetical protein
MFVMLDGMMAGHDGIQAKNGSMIVLVQASNFGGFSGVPVDTDATSGLLVSEIVAMDGFGGTGWSGWNVLGPSAIVGTATSMSGTIGHGGPDQRPSGCPVGFRFWALDATIGGGPGDGALLIWNGGNWKDMAGNNIP